MAWVGLVMALVSLLALDLRLDGGLLGGSGDVEHVVGPASTVLWADGLEEPVVRWRRG